MIIAVDFDGTLCKEQYPGIGAPNENLIAHLIRIQNRGDKLILWTCREGKDLLDAIYWCKEYGLEFDAVNENIFPTKIGFEEYGKRQRKVYADLYIDDRNILPSQLLEIM